MKARGRVGGQRYSEKGGVASQKGSSAGTARKVTTFDLDTSSSERLRGSWEELSFLQQELSVSMMKISTEEQWEGGAGGRG